MSGAPLRSVPTLTEVVQVSAPSQAVLTNDLSIDETTIEQRVLQQVHRHVDLVLEYRLRDALGPLLARLSDTLIHDLRDELSSTLRDVVSRAVAEELARCRGCDAPGLLSGPG